MPGVLEPCDLPGPVSLRQARTGELARFGQGLEPFLDGQSARALPMRRAEFGNDLVPVRDQHGLRRRYSERRALRCYRGARSQSARQSVPRRLTSGMRPPTDSEVLIYAGPGHLLSVLRRFETGEIGAAEVEEWANAIEIRDDIGFEAESDDVVRDVIHVLANPELAGP